SSRNRVPNPPQRITTFTSGPVSGVRPFLPIRLHATRLSLCVWSRDPRHYHTTPGGDPRRWSRRTLRASGGRTSAEPGKDSSEAAGLEGGGASPAPGSVQNPSASGAAGGALGAIPPDRPLEPLGERRPGVESELPGGPRRVQGS